MRFSPAPSGIDHPAFECRVRFSERLVGAVIVRADETRSQPPVTTAPQASPPRTTSPEPTPHANPPDFWKTDLARELLADRTRIEEVLRQLRVATGELQKEQAERLRDLQSVAVELATTMSARLLHERIESGDFPMESKIRDMIQQLDGEPPNAIRLHPADLELLENRLGNEPILPGHENPKLIPDTSLARGACRVEAKEAMLLSDVGRELQEIRDELLRSLAHARS